MIQRILLTQLMGIGDVLMTTPAVQAVRQGFPAAQIVYLTQRPADQLLRHNPHVDEVWIAPSHFSASAWVSLVWRLRGARFDLAIDFFGLPRSALFVGLSGARRRIGFAFRGRRWAYTDPLPLSSTRRCTKGSCWSHLDCPWTPLCRSCS